MKQRWAKVLMGTLFLMMLSVFGVVMPSAFAAGGPVGVRYRTHIQNTGDQGWRQDGETSGTVGESKRLEGIWIETTGEAAGRVEYRTHIQNVGWESGWTPAGSMSGTSGRALRLEAIQIRLTGGLQQKYNIYYRVHAQNFGWLGWAKNGESAGTAGYSYRLEAIQIRMVPSGEPAPGDTANAFREPLVSYQTHVQNIGWQGWQIDGATAGTSGEAKRMEAIRIKSRLGTGIGYRVHVQNIGWQGLQSDGAMAGTSGRGLQLEAIAVHLRGEMAVKYDVYYRVHAQHFGWMGWAKNGGSAGTEGFAFRLEAIQIKFLPKNSPAPGSSTGAFRKAKKIVVLDPGHSAVMPSGTEPIGPGSKTRKAKDAIGTRGRATGVMEYAFMMNLANKLKPELENRGYRVILTRDNNRVAISCAQRAQIANNAHAAAFIRLHANGSSSSSPSGAMTICITRRNPYTAATYQRSRALSQILLNAYCRTTGAKNGGVTEEDNMTGNNWAKVPTTLIEVGYMTNLREDRLMQTSAYQAKMVKGIADGLDAYFKENP